MGHLLICDDESGLRAVLSRYATFSGHTVTEAENGKQAVELCETTDFDLIVLDVMMPEMDGFSALVEIRKQKDIPVLMLTAKGEEYDKVLGFELGVDDYVVKPFSSKEVMLRINAILRRAEIGEQARKPQDTAHELFEQEGLRVDLTSYTVTVDGVVVDLSPKEYELLFFLIRHQNIAMTREKILTDVWGYDYFGDDRTLDTHMKLLRAHLSPYGRMIKTLRGVGYRFDGAGPSASNGEGTC